MPWIKWISNELDIPFHVLVSQLSGHCNARNILWRHQHNVNRASDTRGWFVKIVILTVTYGFVMSCKKWNNVLLSWQTISVLTPVLFWCIFPRCCANREINTKITLEWALEYILSLFIYSWQTRGVGRCVCGLCTCVCCVCVLCCGGGGGGELKFKFRLVAAPLFTNWFDFAGGFQRLHLVNKGYPQ